MNELPYDLYFTHRFNLHKHVGLLIDDYDLEPIARIYGVSLKELQSVQNKLDGEVAAGVAELRKAHPSFDKTIKAIGVGDSITSDRKSWAKLLNGFFKISGGFVIDAGISGDTTSDVINRFYSSVLCHDFDWAVVFIGTNDCRGLDDEYRITNTSLGEYQDNLTYITKALIERHKKVVNVTIPPANPALIGNFFGEENNWTYPDKRIKDTNDFIRKMSGTLGTRLADLAQLIDSTDAKVLDEDGIHLNSAGQQTLAKLLLDIMRK